MSYRHVQRGTAILWSQLVATLIACAMFALTMGQTKGWGIVFAVLPMLALFAGIAWYFSSMMVAVTEHELQWRVGRGGLYRILLSDIERASIVRHPLWHGYGIRWIGPNKRTYIVSGRDVVEVRLNDGGWRRIGTDDAQGLMAALGRR